MGKNKTKNAYYYFVHEFMSKRPRLYDNNNEYFIAASPFWNKLTTAERRPYEEMAAKHKNNVKLEKFTSNGTPLSFLERKMLEKEAKQQRMKDDIDSMLNVALNTDRIAEELFYLIHVNFFCQYTDNMKFIPAELAVARFTLRDGVTSDNVFHIIVQPGRLQLGYSGSARDIAEASHKLPPPTTFEDAKNNMTAVLSGLKAFMREMHPTGHLPPVFAEQKNVIVVENVLDTLIYDYGGLHESFRLRVYPLDYFFYSLRNTVSTKQVWPQISNSILELEKDEYDFCLDVVCQFHEFSDAPNHCSRSHVMRNAYVICDNCCEDLNIELIPGRHVPRKANVEPSRPISRASSEAASFQTAIGGSNRGTSKEDDYYLSATEVFSETSTLVDPDEYPRVAAGFSQNESAYTDEDNWEQPKQRRNRQHANRSVSGQSDYSEENMPISLSQGADVRNRRPITLSAAFSGLSISNQEASGAISKIGRGRGRGFSEKK